MLKPQILDPIELPDPVPYAHGCEQCDGYGPVPGIIWKPRDSACSPAVTPVQIVERCDTCERYASDEIAAQVIAKRYGLQAVFLCDEGTAGVINPNAPGFVAANKCSHRISTTRVYLPGCDHLGQSGHTLVVGFTCKVCFASGQRVITPSQITWDDGRSD
jgi:hypothetical protein